MAGKPVSCVPDFSQVNLRALNISSKKARILFMIRISGWFVCHLGTVKSFKDKFDLFAISTIGTWFLGSRRADNTNNVIESGYDVKDENSARWPTKLFLINSTPSSADRTQREVQPKGLHHASEDDDKYDTKLERVTGFSEPP